MTIDQTISWLAWTLVLTGLVLGIVAVRRVFQAGRLRYYLLRREQAAGAWRLLLVAATVTLASIVVFAFGRPAAYMVFPPTPSVTPTPTPSSTPTITQTPTITVTPSISLTPSVTPTATASFTPELPESLQLLYQDDITPEPEAILSPILVATSLTSFNIPIDPAEAFDNPVGRLYGAFSYDHMTDGVRWSAFWNSGEETVCFETKPWDGGTGGYGYTDCLPEGGWPEGEYEIQVFIGTEWEVSTRFQIRGALATATLTATATP
jgi:type VI secretion system secreted protein VgrG